MDEARFSRVSRLAMTHRLGQTKHDAVLAMHHIFRPAGMSTPRSRLTAQMALPQFILEPKYANQLNQLLVR